MIVRNRLYTDRRDDHGPFDVIGDVHGCRAELEALLSELGYLISRDDQGRPTAAHHPGRRVIFVGDLVDRGPDSPGVLRLVMGMVADGDALCVSGNHEAKLSRALRGRKVQVSHGLAETLAQLEQTNSKVTVTFASRAGSSYYVQSTTTPGVSASWQDLAGPFTGNLLHSTTLVATNAACFYRLRVTTP